VQAQLVPRYIMDRDTIAKSCGLAVTRHITEEDKDQFGVPSRTIVTVWSGTIKQVRSTGFFADSLSEPKRQAWWISRNLGFHGNLTKNGKTFTLKFEELLPAALFSFARGVEVSMYRQRYCDQAHSLGFETIEVYGSADSLLKAGIVMDAWLPRKKFMKRNGDYFSVSCQVRRQPNGLYLCLFERYIEGDFEVEFTRGRAKALFDFAIGKRDAAFTRFLTTLYEHQA
jgi:hypothetical protein